jgi:VCBS repeat-containing protein
MPLELLNPFNVYDNDTLNIGGQCYTVATADVSGTTYLFASAVAESGISVFSVGTNGSLTNVFNINDDATLNLRGNLDFVAAQYGGDTYLFVGSGHEGGVSLFRVGADGSLTNTVNIADDLTLNLNGVMAVGTATVGAETYFFASGFSNDSGISVFSVGPGGTLTNVFNNSYANPGLYPALWYPSDMATTVVDGSTYLFVTADAGSALTAFRVESDGSLINTAAIVDDGTVNLSYAEGVTVAHIGAATYVFTASAGDNGISVFSVGSGGTLTNVFNINDDATLNLQTTYSLTTLAYGGTTYLLAVGYDDSGVSAFAINADGSLTPAFNFSDTATSALLGPVDIASATIGGHDFAFVAASLDGGVGVFALDAPPVSQDGSASGNENTIIHGTLSATDSDTATLTFSRATQTAHGSVVVNADGSFDYTPDLNYHGPDSFTFVANDGIVDSNVATLAITVAPGNHAPTDIQLSHAAVAENSANGTVVGSLTDIDPDAGDTAVFNLLDTAGGRFGISGNNLVVTNGSLLDYETSTSHAVTVRVTDSGGLTFDKSFTIGITDVHEPPRPYNWAGSGDLGYRGDHYQVAGVGDFNGDGTADVLWRNPTTGRVDEWRMQNDNWAGSVDLGARGTSQQVAGIGDFNGDGTDDVLWRDSATGRLDLWIMANGQWSKSVDLGAHGTDWKVLGVGDFNGDGTDDVMFSNTTSGAVDEWVMRDGNWSKSVSLGTHNLAWSASAIGDFDGDGTDDVLWYNSTTGQTEQWHMEAGNWAGSIGLGSFNTAYDLAAVNDFNGDGTADVLWRNHATGKVDGWVMDDGNWFSSVTFGALDPAFALSGTGDFNHADGADVLWHNATTGQVGTWLLHAI